MKTEHVTINPGPYHRLLEPGEKIQSGDEYLDGFHGGWKRSHCIGDPYEPRTLNLLPHRRNKDAPVCEPGYEFLYPGDPVLETDEINMRSAEHPRWIVWDISSDTARDAIFRRRLPEPSTGYRMLKAGEIIEKGDEFVDGHNRSKGIMAWEPIHEDNRLQIGCELYPSNVGFFRRKLPAPAIEPGEGWRLLADDEVIEKGDESYVAKFGWEACNGSVGDTRSSWAFEAVRRKIVRIDPGTGWRLLADDEVIGKGDMYYYRDWVACGSTVGDTVSEARKTFDFIEAFRRRTGPHPVETCGCNTCENVVQNYNGPSHEVEDYPGELKKLRETVAKLRDQSSLLAGVAQEVTKILAD